MYLPARERQRKKGFQAAILTFASWTFHSYFARWAVGRSPYRRTVRGTQTNTSQNGGPSQSIDSEIVKYLNRLSDLLFTAARLLSHISVTDEIEWKVAND